MIPKRAIEQARIAHRELMNQIWNRVLESMRAEWNTLESSYDSGDKTCKATIKAISKERKTRKDEAWKNHLRDTRTKEGGKYDTYQEEERLIDENCDSQVAQAQQTRSKANMEAEARYQKRIKDILSTYKDDSDACVDKFIAEHP